MSLSPVHDLKWLAEYLGLSECVCRDMLRVGTLPGVRLGGRWRVRESAIQAALDRMERERAEVGDHAARVLRGVREARTHRRLVVPPRIPPCRPSTPSSTIPT